MLHSFAVAPEEITVVRGPGLLRGRWRWDVATNVWTHSLVGPATQKLTGFGFALTQVGAHNRAKRFIRANLPHTPPF